MLENITKPFNNVQKEVRQARGAISTQVIKKLKDMQFEKWEPVNLNFLDLFLTLAVLNCSTD